MTLPKPVSYCPICAMPLYGRRDKIFCSGTCKNAYDSEGHEQRLPFSDPIDQILHRNWVILAEFYELAGRRKFFVSKAELRRAGFHSHYFTTSPLNNEQKTYFYGYNYGWREFSEKVVMVDPVIQIQVSS